MIGLLQRVTEGRVRVHDKIVAEIGTGLLVLVGVQRGDNEARAERLVERLLSYRVFPDIEGRMNQSLQDIGGGLLLVPQFTLAADTRKGTRASFSKAAAPAEGERLFNHMYACAKAGHPAVGRGIFGANMQVELVNDGPVTFWLET